MMRSHSILLAASLCAVAAVAETGKAPALPRAAAQLAQEHPGVQFWLDQGRVRTIYGAPMAYGATPRDAADNWLATYGGAFDVGELEASERWSSDLRHGRFTVFAYQQSIQGFPVDGSALRVLVLNEPVPQVVYAAGVLAPAPAAGVPAPSVSAEAALTRARGLPLYSTLPNWSVPEFVIHHDHGANARPTLAWRFVGEEPNLEKRRKYTFFVDAATGRLLEARNEVLHVDLAGRVQAWATPGTLPDIASNPPVLMNVPDIRVAIDGGGSAYADREGNFVIADAGAGPLLVTTQLGPQIGDGRFVWIDDRAGPEVLLSTAATPPAPADFVFNDPPAALTTAQTNAFIGTNLIYRYIKDREPNFTPLDVSFRANVNLTQTCNAYFDGNSINFFQTGGGCVNTAYSTVIAHEYGHFIVNRLGLTQGGFGEGYSDVVAMLLYDTPIVGENFFVGGGYIRNPLLTNRQYPCSNQDPHVCGELIGGVWWEIRLAFGDAFGEPAGLELVRQLQTDWTLITTGGQGPNNGNSAHPGTAIEVLTLDDDDGDLANGTPNYALICPAFTNHNVQCPAIALLDFVYPGGVPTALVPNQPTPIAVEVNAHATFPQPGTGKLFFSVNGAAFAEAGVVESTPNRYVATLPATPCGASVRFYIQAQTQGGLTVTDPGSAPAAAYAAVADAGQPQVIVFADSFETDAGWTVGAPGDTATTGVWNRGDPEGTLSGTVAVQPEDDHTSGPGTQCYATDTRAGSGLGTYDVDGGATTLVSPVLDLSSVRGVKIGYWRWYSNARGNAPNADVLTVDVSNDGGANWANVETVGPGGPETDGGWFYREFRVTDFVALSAAVRVRFVASDLDAGSVVEAAVDDFVVTGVQCIAACPGDADGDGRVDQDDLDTVLFNYGASVPPGTGGDLDGDGDVDQDDLDSVLFYFGQQC